MRSICLTPPCIPLTPLFPFVAILLYNVDNMYKNTSTVLESLSFCVASSQRLLASFALLTRIPLRSTPPTEPALTARSPTGNEPPSDFCVPTSTTPHSPSFSFLFHLAIRLWTTTFPSTSSVLVCTPSHPGQALEGHGTVGQSRRLRLSSKGSPEVRGRG